MGVKVFWVYFIGMTNGTYDRLNLGLVNSIFDLSNCKCGNVENSERNQLEKI